MKINATLFIIVDEVDIEQAGIAMGDSPLAQSRAIKAQAAARENRRMVVISDLLNEIDHTLVFDKTISVLGKGEKVHFTIRQKTLEEMVHA